MPGVFTELYVANQVSELTKKSELTSHQKQNPKLLVKALDKIHNAGNEHRLLGDEEKAYIHFVKVLNMHSVIKESIEYKTDTKYYDAMLNEKTIVDCRNQAEEISDSLQRRYEEREARKAAGAQQTRAPAADDKVDGGFDDPFDFTSGSEPAISKSNQSIGKPVTAANTELSLSVSHVELYKLLKGEAESQPLVIDMRSENEFNESQINYGSVEMINIPEKLLSPGILPETLRSKLTARNQSLFDARANYKRIVLIDWDSTVEDLSLTNNPLRVVKDAIYKWDQQTHLASEPQILEGGYKQWVTFYPQHTTNPQVQGLAIPKAKIDIPDLDSISYNFDDDAEGEPVIQTTPAPAAAPASTVTP